MRKGFDSLAALVQTSLDQDALSGDLFVFRSRRCDRIKLLYWDEDGYALWYKRLEEGSFALPAADGKRAAAGAHGLVLRPAELSMVLDGIDLANVHRQKRYRRPAATAVT
jgi:transposase